MSFRPGPAHVTLTPRRLAAAVIDMALFFSFLWVLGVVSYPLSAGLIRHRSDLFASRDCIGVNVPPVEPPAWIVPADARLCRTSVFGVIVDRSFALDGPSPTGAPVSWSLPANDRGQPASALYLDPLHFTLMILAFAGLESIAGWTFGKHLLGVRILDAETRRPLTFYRSLERNSLIYGPLAFAELATFIASLVSPTGPKATIASWFWFGAVGWIGLCVAALAIAQPRSLLDRWTGVVIDG